MSILAGALFGLFRLFRTSPRLAAVVSGLLVMLYAGLAGGSASVMRAAVMANIYLLAVVLDRRGDLLNTWALSALALLWWNPRFLEDVGFQLTFLATLGILLFLPRCEHLLDRAPRPIRYLLESVALTLAATAMTLPVLAVNFNRLSPVGLLANIPIVPLSGLITASGTAAAALFAFQPGGLPWLNAANGWLVDLLLALATWFAGFPWSTVRVYTPTGSMVLCYYAALAAFFLSLPLTLDPPLIGQPNRTRQRAAWAGVGCVALLAGCIVWRLFPAASPLVRLTCLDVGQGEAILVETPGPRRMLVDAGGRIGDSFDLGQYVIAPFLLHEWVGRLDVLVLTHPDSDHMGGAPALLKSFAVGEVWTGSGPAVSGAEVWIQEFLRLRRIPHRIVAAGSPVGWEGTVDVLHPPRERSLLSGSRTKANNRSVVLRIRREGQSILLTGDIEREAENFLVATGMPLAADVLKVPHHGSRNASTDAFLAAVRPQAAVVSVGYRNPYRHPHPLVLGRFQAMGIKLFRTDREGAITVDLQAGRVRLRPRRGEDLVLTGAPDLSY